MNDYAKVIELTERLRLHVETQQETVRQVQSDLEAHGAALGELLEWLRQTEYAAGDGGALCAEGDRPPSPDHHSAQDGERRLLPRRKGNPISMLVCNPLTGAPHFQGMVVDRSPDGLCLVLDRDVEVGSSLLVRPFQDLTRSDWFPVKVKTCRPEFKIWVAGCQFTQRLSWEDLRLFG